MKYRIQCDVCYTNQADLNALLNYIEGIKSNCASGVDNGESITRSARYHLCFHDDVTPVRCDNYSEIDFDGAQVSH